MAGYLRSDKALWRIKRDKETIVMRGKMRRYAVVLLLILLLVLWACVVVSAASMVWSG
jgi:hypothetical protein